MLNGNRFEAKAMTVGDILDMLNGYQLHRVLGGPDWMRIDRYDIEAKTDRLLDGGERNQAVLALLAARFQLQLHRERRELPGIILRAPQKSGVPKEATGEEHYSIASDRGDVVFTAVTMSSLTNYLSQMSRLPVVDETELKGRYDFTLAISQIESQSQMSWGDRVREAVEAVGFRVEDRKIPLDVTVVDHCERPTEN